MALKVCIVASVASITASSGHDVDRCGAVALRMSQRDVSKSSKGQRGQEKLERDEI